jgi:IstB-like ATP binding protein
VVDELGYLSLDQQTSNLFYQVISTRHSHKRSTLITTNTAFSDWGNILYNTTIATAIADRLVENSEIFLLGGESLRKGNTSQPPTAYPIAAGSDQAPLCDDIPHGGVRRVTPQRRCRRGRETLPLSRFLHLCSTSAPIICSPGPISRIVGSSDLRG